MAHVLSRVSTLDRSSSLCALTAASAASSCDIAAGGGGGIAPMTLAASVCPALPAAECSWSVSMSSFVFAPIGALSQHPQTLETAIGCLAGWRHST